MPFYLYRGNTPNQGLRRCMNEKMSPTVTKDTVTQLESRQYNFLVEGTMPILEFEITPGAERTSSGPQTSNPNTHLRIEIYNPLAGEVFEAKFPKGRIEVDSDGSMTYFSTGLQKVNLSLFLGHSVSIILEKDGQVTVKTPSKITSLRNDFQSDKKKRRDEATNQPTTDSISFKLE